MKKTYLLHQGRTVHAAAGLQLRLSLACREPQQKAQNPVPHFGHQPASWAIV